MKRNILIFAMALCCAGCSTTGSDHLEAADDANRVAAELRSGGLTPAEGATWLDHHAETLRAWGAK